MNSCIFAPSSTRYVNVLHQTRYRPWLIATNALSNNVRNTILWLHTRIRKPSAFV